MSLISFQFLLHVLYHLLKILKERDRIKVIPQGFDLSKPAVPPYQPNLIPTFAYAGVFYNNIRNPKDFFSYLMSLTVDFRFILYTDYDNYENRLCIEPFVDALGTKLVIKPMIDREDCIIELSKMDFLINMENRSSSQLPSKLIDYYLAKRPVFTFSMDSFDKSGFFAFSNGDYSQNISNLTNISEYNIRKVCQEYLDLINTIKI